MEASLAVELSVNIRKFEKKDRDQVRSISHDTAFMGQPASLFFEGREIICDALNLYFTDYEPESCFVAEANSTVVGYLIGAKSKITAENFFKDRVILYLFWKALRSGVFLKRKNIAFIFSCLQAFLTGGLATPDFTKEYPATLHINISEKYRGKNIGTALISAYLGYLKQSLVPGVHLATLSQAGADFFAKQSFQLLYEGKRPYFRRILQKDVPLYIYGKKLAGL